MRWPGAINVAKGNTFTFLYIGYGMKKGDSPFNPTEPPMVQQDPSDQVEQPEPTPLTEPPVEEKADGDEDDNNSDE